MITAASVFNAKHIMVVLPMPELLHRGPINSKKITIHTVCLPQFIQKPELKKLFNECIAELRQTPRYRATLGDKPVIVGTKNTPSVKNLLVRARLK
jgi:hypothetical protein